VFFPYAYCYRCPHGREYPSCDIFCVDFIEKNILSGKETPLGDQKSKISNVAALIIEPMQCSGGYIIPPDEFLQGLKKLSDKYNFLLIVDEIQAGLGRTGKLWGVEHSGVEPDILVIGKGISGGLPFGAIVARKEILSNWAPCAHVSTFAGYALGSANALKVLEIIEKEKLIERSNKIGTYFYNKLLELKEDYSIIGDVTGGKGLFLAVELVKDRKTKEPAISETEFIREKCYDEGLLFQTGGYLYNRLLFIPALTITKDSIDRAISILKDVLEITIKRFL
ncbi:MAG: aminotransferase class III-fold pyridoxal phosphate-dependent enzyme, partial [Actinobacteria bacterium]|nr:aminotransferase class III-fold pyridoxal phosphate-dependent enzyme [Actinomycetota bacterium]